MKFVPRAVEQKILHLNEIAGKTHYGYGAVQAVGDPFYRDLFSQGADFMPQTLFFVDIEGRRNRPVLDVQTSGEERSNPLNKKAKNLHARGPVEAEYVFWTMKSDQVLPFIHGALRPLVLPLRVKGERYDILSQQALQELGATHAAAWFENVQRKAKAAKANPDKPDRTLDDIREPLRTRGKVTNQPTKRKDFAVFMGAGGANVCAAVGKSRRLNAAFLNHQTLYLMETGHEDEAYYVVGMLNSTVVNDLIKESQPRGQQGQQHVHERALVFPKFDKGNKDHMNVAKVARELEAGAAELVQSNPNLLTDVGSLPARRKKMVTLLDKTYPSELRTLNDAAARIMGGR